MTAGPSGQLPRRPPAITGWRRPFAPAPGTRIPGKSNWTQMLPSISWTGVVGIFLAHLVFATESVPLLARVLLAVPAALCIVEVTRYLRSDEKELPFVAVWLAQYYLTFGFEVFFDLQFYDLRGPIDFSPTIRIQGALASALGCMSFWIVARLVMRAGHNLPQIARRLLPPETLPEEGWDAAFYVWSGLSLASAYVITVASGSIPIELGLLVVCTFPIQFAIGLAIARPPRRLGPLASQGLLAFGMLSGIASGQIEPMGRTVVAYVSARLARTRKLAVGLLVVMGALFLVIQPTKAKYREQVWGYNVRTGVDVGLTGRIDAWDSALSSYFTETISQKKEEPAVTRVTELGSVMHALMVVPGQVDYAYGATLLQILYAPIPRFIWKDKPDSRHEVVQQYAVIFGRQSSRKVDTTAIGMCLLVEGFWNFGWLGFVLVGAAMGAFMGVQQRLFSGNHWALFACGVAQIAMVTGSAPLVASFGSIFQYTVGHLISVWSVYQLAVVLGKKRTTKAAPAHPSGRAAAATNTGFAHRGSRR